ncbi:MAG TPA: hypothetical protein VIJ10_16155 [Vicinamibacteria bacterium]
MSPAARRRKAKVDPELRRQLDDGAAAARPSAVEAVLRLRAPVRRAAHARGPEDVRETARKLLARVAGEVGLRASDYEFNVFPNLGYCVLSAPPVLVECVLRQPEVVSASANRRD